MRRHRSCRGFTLAECLVAVVILGVGLVAVVGCLTAALLTGQTANHTAVATAAAQDTLEEMRSRGFGSISYAEFPASSPVAELRQGQRTVEITDSYKGDSRLKKVKVDISWRSRGATTSHVRLETVVSNRAGHRGTS
jgi:prepilin-type N-terminal cleavage/methylation domain-containing protein